jgi:hypothetical protein
MMDLEWTTNKYNKNSTYAPLESGGRIPTDWWDMRKILQVTDGITRKRDYQTEWSELRKGWKISESQKSFSDVMQQAKEIQENRRTEEYFWI